MPERIKKTEKYTHVLSWVGSVSIVATVVLLSLMVDVKAAGNFAFLFITVNCILFCLMYSRSRWRETEPGRATMYIVGSFALIGIVVCLSLFLGTGYPGREFVRLIGYLAVALAVFNVSVTLYRYQRESKIYRQLARNGGAE